MDAQTIARDTRWGMRTRIGQVHRIARVSWAEAAYRRSMLVAAITGLIKEAEAKGMDIGDFTIAVEPDALPPGTIRVELRGVVKDS